MRAKRYVILGAGISGLSLAWYLKKKCKNASITVLEKSHRTGGWIQTVVKDNFIFELGPRSCRTKGTGLETLKLIEDLGLENQVITANSSAKKRFLYINQKLRSLPTGPISLLCSPFKGDILRSLWQDLQAASGNQDDESIYDFISRRLGSGIANKFMDPLTSGIYAGNIHQLSLKSCFPLLHEWEKTKGSLIKGALAKKKVVNNNLSPFVERLQKEDLFSFKDGMETLTHEIKRQLNSHIKLKNHAVGIQFHSDEVVVELNNGTVMKADHLFSALPLHALGDLIKPLSPKLEDILRSIPSSSVAVVSFGYKKNVLKHKGFGYLVPSQEKEDILGVVWDSCVFSDQNYYPKETRLTVMIGGAHMPNFNQFSESMFLEMALKSLFKHLGIQVYPDVIEITLARYAIPQYLVGHTEKLQQINQALSALTSRMTFLGNGFEGVSINDCIARAKKCADLEMGA